MTLEAVAALQPLADAKQLTLAVDESDLPPVLADPMRCKQILYNFLSNAIKFTPAAGRISVAFFSDGARARVEVHDTGPGIRPADLERLFRPFSQLERMGASSSLGGTGLGLALTKQLAELMGGSVGVKSDPGHGSTFFVELPADSQPAPEVSPLADDLRSLVLIVDDDPQSRELLSLTLGEAGYRTRSASTGETGLELARQLQPAVILLDVLLPGMDGWQLLRELRSLPETAKIPVVMATVSSDRQRAFGLGALAHLIKPIDRHALLETLARHSFSAKVDAQPVHVLVVDDDPRHVELVRACLEPKGFSVSTALSGKEGLEVAARGPCDLLLLDLMLPDLSGVEVVAELRRNPLTRALPIILITGRDLSDADAARLQGDVHAVLTKGDLRLDDLLREVNQVVRKPF